MNRVYLQSRVAGLLIIADVLIVGCIMGLIGGLHDVAEVSPFLSGIVLGSLAHHAFLNSPRKP